MSTRTLPLDDRLYSYLHGVSLREPPVHKKCRMETAQLPMGSMQIAPEQGQFLHLQLQLMGARRAIEIGSFTGYSGLWIASALPRGGCMVACDNNEKWLSRARGYWAEADVMDRIELRLGDATQTLEDLLKAGQDESYDFVFIDADKAGYDDYYERSLSLLRPGGLVAIDNVLWNGKVADYSCDDPDTCAIRHLNEKLHRDQRINLALVPVGDGMTLCRKKG